MISIVTIAVSVVISVITSITANSYLMKNDSGYNSLLKFARNNKDLKKYNLEDICRKLSELENRVSGMNISPQRDDNAVYELRREIETLKNTLNNLMSQETAENDDTESIKVALAKITHKVIELENSVSGFSAPAAVDLSAVMARIASLENAEREKDAEIAALRQIIESRQTVNKQPQEERQPVESRSVQEVKPEQNNVSGTVKVIIPDEEYVGTLIENLSAINNVLGSFENGQYMKGLKNLLDDGDFDDPEEIMGAVHSLIEKYIYGSDTKVSAAGWAELEKYIVSAGYVPVPVKAGDDVTKYKAYFSRPIQADGQPENAIKQIQQQPYVLVYNNDGERETLKLCGKCTYYKQKR